MRLMMPKLGVTKPALTAGSGLCSETAVEAYGTTVTMLGEASTLLRTCELLQFVGDNHAIAPDADYTAFFSKDEERFVFGDLLTELTHEQATESIGARIAEMVRKLIAMLRGIFAQVVKYLKNLLLGIGARGKAIVAKVKAIKDKLVGKKYREIRGVTFQGFTTNTSDYIDAVMTYGNAMLAWGSGTMNSLLLLSTTPTEQWGRVLDQISSLPAKKLPTPRNRKIDVFDGNVGSGEGFLDRITLRDTAFDAAGLYVDHLESMFAAANGYLERADTVADDEALSKVEKVYAAAAEHGTVSDQALTKFRGILEMMVLAIRTKMMFAMYLYKLTAAIDIALDEANHAIDTQALPLSTSGESLVGSVEALSMDTFDRYADQLTATMAHADMFDQVAIRIVEQHIVEAAKTELAGIHRATTEDVSVMFSTLVDRVKTIVPSADVAAGYTKAKTTLAFHQAFAKSMDGVKYVRLKKVGDCAWDIELAGVNKLATVAKLGYRNLDHIKSTTERGKQLCALHDEVHAMHRNVTERLIVERDANRGPGIEACVIASYYLDCLENMLVSTINQMYDTLEAIAKL